MKQATPDTPRRRSKRTPQKRKVEPEVEMEDDEQDNDLEAESDADSMVGNMRCAIQFSDLSVVVCLCPSVYCVHGCVSA